MARIGGRGPGRAADWRRLAAIVGVGHCGAPRLSFSDGERSRRHGPHPHHRRQRDDARGPGRHRAPHGPRGGARRVGRRGAAHVSPAAGGRRRLRHHRPQDGRARAGWTWSRRCASAIPTAGDDRDRLRHRRDRRRGDAARRLRLPQKPFAPEVVRLKVARALELRGERRARERAEAESAALRADAAAPYRFDEIVGETPADARACSRPSRRSRPPTRRSTSTANRAPARSWWRAPSTRARSARDGPVRQGQLRRAHRDAARVASCSGTRRGRSPARSSASSAASSWPTRGRCSSTRSAT